MFAAWALKVGLDCLATYVIFAKPIEIGISTHGLQCLSFAWSD